nr:unnamed protein product [Digitaria exilis]
MATYRCIAIRQGRPARNLGREASVTSPSVQLLVVLRPVTVQEERPSRVRKRCVAGRSPTSSPATAAGEHVAGRRGIRVGHACQIGASRSVADG